MAAPRARKREVRAAEDERCVFCHLSEHLRHRLDRHRGTIAHLDRARREILEAVREVVDGELDRMETALRNRKSRRKKVTRIEVEG